MDLRLIPQEIKGHSLVLFEPKEVKAGRFTTAVVATDTINSRIKDSNFSQKAISPEPILI